MKIKFHLIMTLDEGKLMDYKELNKIAKKEAKGEYTKEQADLMYDKLVKDDEKFRISLKKRYIIAMLDLLGFKNYLNQHTIEDIFNEYNRLRFKLWDHMDRQNETLYVGPKGTTPPEDLYNPIPYVFFSDTILVWYRLDLEDPKAPNKINRFLHSIQLLVSNMLVKGIPLRGGISYGECMISHEHNIYLGQPIVNAYLTESNQEWINIAFHSSFTELIDHLPLNIYNESISKAIIEYPIPVKPKIPFSLSKAVVLINRDNIRKNLIQKLIPGIDTLPCNAKEKQKILKKYQHTLTFLDHLDDYHAA